MTQLFKNSTQTKVVKMCTICSLYTLKRFREFVEISEPFGQGPKLTLNASDILSAFELSFGLKSPQKVVWNHGHQVCAGCLACYQHKENRLCGICDGMGVC